MRWPAASAAEAVRSKPAGHGRASVEGNRQTRLTTAGKPSPTSQHARQSHWPTPRPTAAAIPHLAGTLSTQRTVYNELGAVQFISVINICHAATAHAATDTPAAPPASRREDDARKTRTRPRHTEAPSSPDRPNRPRCDVYSATPAPRLHAATERGGTRPSGVRPGSSSNQPFVRRRPSRIAAQPHRGRMDPNHVGSRRRTHNWPAVAHPNRSALARFLSRISRSDHATGSRGGWRRVAGGVAPRLLAVLMADRPSESSYLHFV